MKGLKYLIIKQKIIDAILASSAFPEYYLLILMENIQ
jgi:hypothetical protein